MIRFTVTLNEEELAALRQHAGARQVGIVAGHLIPQPIDVALAKVLAGASHDYLEDDPPDTTPPAPAFAGDAAGRAERDA